MSAATPPLAVARADSGSAIAAWGRRNAWIIGLLVILAVLFAFTKTIQPRYGPIPIQAWRHRSCPSRWRRSPRPSS